MPKISQKMTQQTSEHMIASTLHPTEVVVCHVLPEAHAIGLSNEIRI